MALTPGTRLDPVQLRPRFGGASSFDLHPDGERVVMAPGTAAAAGPTHVTLIFNVFDELRRLAPVTTRRASAPARADFPTSLMSVVPRSSGSR